MKALIWIGCIVGGALIATLLEPPAIVQTLILAGEMALATYLCKKWNEYKEEKEENEDEDEK